MRKKLGTQSILYYARYLQLSWIGTIRRLSTDRLPRKFLTSWIPLPRGVGRPVSDYTDTILKALESVGIGEDMWFHLAKDEFWWRNFIATTDEERKELLSAFRRGMNIAGPSGAAGNFDLSTSIEMPDTPLSRRRMGHLIAGGWFAN